MTEKQAQEIMEKTVINGTPHANTLEYMEALNISIDILGKDYTRDQLKNWILVGKYPFLSPKYWNSDSMKYEVAKNYDYTYTELDAMPNGWKKTFGEMMCEEIYNALIECNGLDDYIIEQVKEKYGALRWYSYPSYKEVERIIDKYSVLSQNICAVCGKPDVPMTGHQWIYPLCKKCYCTPNEFVIEDMSDEQIKKFWDEHEEDWEEWYKEDGKMSDCYTVHRWSKDKDEPEEIVYDIKDTADKIRKRWKG